MVARQLPRRSAALFLVSVICLVTIALLSQRSSGLCEDGTFCHKVTTALPASGSQPDPECKDFPDTSNILLAMKTSASEAYNKIPMHLTTTFRCVPESNYIIFSDADQEINGIQIHDCLDEIVEQVMDSNPDFDVYRRQKECLVDFDTCNRFGNYSAESKALEKYKTIHMAAKAYKIQPDRDWYVFVDTESFVSWSTLAAWLKNMDPSKELYFGSASRIGQFPFASAEGAYGLSNALAKRLFGGRRALSNRWDFEIIDSCCGDIMFGMFVEDMAELKVLDTWPTTNTEKPSRLGFGTDQWCHPIATMHRVGGQELSVLHAFEKEHGLGNPLRIKDIYHQFVEALMQPLKQDWDNLSEDVYYIDPDVEHEEKHRALAKTKNLSPIEKKAHVSFNACQQTCTSNPDCVQFRYHQGVCSTGRSFSFGRPMKKEMRLGDKWLSGWDMEKIKAFVEASQECGEMIWPQGSMPYIPPEDGGGLVG